MQTITLNNGVQMPILGYGVFQVSPAECEQCVSDAIRAGYRLIDTAQAYANEEGVGNAVKKSGIAREEFFIVTKVWISNAGYEKAKASIEASLEKLQTDYIDLLLIHQPFGDYYGTYRAMEEAYQNGKVRAIGVSNFYPDRFVDLAENVTVKPAVNQVETHAFFQQNLLQRTVQPYGTHLMAWSPFVQGKNNFFGNEILSQIGAKYGKTVGQTALRNLIQRNIIAIPKTVNFARMEENINVFDFELSADDIAKIATLDTGKSLIFDHHDPEGVKYLLNYKLG